MVSIPKFLPAACRCGASGFLVKIEPSVELHGLKFTRPEVVSGSIPVSAPERTLRVATHEASHAAIVHTLGYDLLSVTAEDQPHCLRASISCHADRAAVALAGGHGERLVMERREFRPYDKAVLTTFNVVRELRMGGCDQCTAALAMFGYCGPNPGDVDLLAAYRRVEAATIDAVREPKVRCAIRSLAGRLMSVGTVDEAEAHRIIENIGVEFGSRTII